MRDSSLGSLPLLHNGRCERLKAGVHAVVLGTAAVCAAYNFAAWLVRRQRHSAVNTGLYAALAVWECVHVRRHLDHARVGGVVRESVTRLEIEASYPDGPEGMDAIAAWPAGGPHEDDGFTMAVSGALTTVPDADEAHRWAS